MDVFLWEGSKSSLEEMTGKKFEAVRGDDGTLTKMIVFGDSFYDVSGRSSFVEKLDNKLKENAKNMSWAGYVEVRRNFFGLGDSLVAGYVSGYLVREV